MRVFITGIAGFIGSHLAHHLHKTGHTISGCDNFNAYYDPKLKYARAALLQKDNITIHTCDIVDPSLSSIISAFNPTHIVHLAAQAGVRHAAKDPQAYVHSNLAGFVNIMEICKTIPKVRCIYASSSSVYGLNTKTPFAETDRTDAPSSLYGATKKANELIATAYHHLYQIPLIGLRFFTVYGPMGRPDMAYFAFTKAIDKGAPIQLYGTGDAERDFTYITDIVQGIESALNAPTEHAIFNLGNHKPEKVSTLIHLIENALGKKAQIAYLPKEPSDVPLTYADLSLSTSVLHYTPSVSLKEGIDAFISWYKCNK